MIFCLEDCIFAGINKDDYFAIFNMNVLSRHEIDLKFKFFDSVSIFNGQNMIFIEKLIQAFQVRNITYGELLLKQGEPTNDIFIIKSGMCSVEYTYENTVVNNYGLKYFSLVNNERFSQNRFYELLENIQANEIVKVTIN